MDRYLRLLRPASSLEAVVQDVIAKLLLLLLVELLSFRLYAVSTEELPLLLHESGLLCLLLLFLLPAGDF